MRHLLVALLLCLGLGAAPLLAQDAEKKEEKKDTSARAEEVLKKAQDRLYNPRALGMTDARFEVESPMFAMFLQGAKLVYYFKAAKEGSKTEDRTKLKVEGGQGGDPMAQAPMLQNMTKHLEKAFGLFLGVSNPVKELQDQKKFSVLACDEQDGKLVVTLTPKADAPKDKVNYKKQVLTFDKKHTLLAVKIVSDDKTMEFKPSFVEKDGKLLLAGQSGMQMGMEAKMTLEWQKVQEKYWVPKTMTQKMGDQGMEMQFTFKEFQINKGVDDAVFK